MTPYKLQSLSCLSAVDVDTVIDVRAPSEYDEDHLPGAINLPVLSDAERAKVGAIYAQQSPFRARKIGAALVAANAARHLQGPLADMPGDWQPLVYCWRGGQRSGSFATILDQVGWRVRLLDGGYRSYRRQVVARLYDTELPHRLRLIDGGTGTGKTALLHHLRAAGAQVIDLEGLAEHRGSLFGSLGPQPTQKMFETRLAEALNTLDPDRLTWVEAESSKVGDRIVPPAVWAAMGRAPRIEVSAPLPARSNFLVSAYADLLNHPSALAGRIDQLRPFHASDTVAQWHSLARNGAWRALAQALIAEHYDPRYAKSQARADMRPDHFPLDTLEDETLARAAATLSARFT